MDNLEQMTWKQIERYANRLALSYGEYPTETKLNHLHALKTMAQHRYFQAWKEENLCQNKMTV